MPDEKHSLKIAMVPDFKGDVLWKVYCSCDWQYVDKDKKFAWNTGQMHASLAVSMDAAQEAIFKKAENRTDPESAIWDD